MLKNKLNLIDLAPRFGERAGLFGKTGCGKTTLARMLLSQFEYAIVYDAKRSRILAKELKPLGFKRITKLNEVARSKEKRIIYAPRAEELPRVNKSFVEKFFWWIYERGNTCLYVDEIYLVVIGNDIPAGYHACLAQGRERGVTVIQSSQRPIDVPQVVLSESDRYYTFHLKLPQDREKLEKITGIERERLSPQNLKKYRFYYCTETSDEAVGPMRVNL